ncbi:MAG: P1 family peptidase [Anaerolineaceae bacterium]|nr:P1 family peptidase [Anaerolineaceae bacterium]
MMERLKIIDVPGIKVGHAEDANALTGCTVVLCEQGAVGGVDQRGGAPGTRETDLLRPMHMVQQVHAVLLTGGSAFGLDAAGGVMRYLEERGIGFDVGVGVVPIVPGAVIFDLALGNPKARPDAAMGYFACENAASEALREGNAGAGMGASVGKLLGMENAMKGGIGSAALEIVPGIFIGALFVVNAAGDVIDPANGKITAGARLPVAMGGPGFADSLRVMRQMTQAQFAARQSNTVIGVVATNVKLTKEQCCKLAQMAQDGIAQTIRPAHTMLDGDTIFALSTGDVELDFNVISAFAAQVSAEAIIAAVREAEGLGGLPAARDFLKQEEA